ncbi:hypothetical protein [Mitsuaria sp. WAJ17]|uniref:hypothetical protein n=1 Tax=Mitsuaria sp. WAJ17 TaxID=2761452 RepID=UPI0016009C52|nr:hypothetical protein [Mitsuaria sp. WAJ17]
MKLVAAILFGLGCMTAAAQTANDVFPNIPYTRTTRIKLLKPSGAPNSGKTAALMMNDSGSCNTSENGYCERSSDTYSGAAGLPSNPSRKW